jgi:hypothetical protein
MLSDLNQCTSSNIYCNSLGCGKDLAVYFYILPGAEYVIPISRVN